jgi:gamma-glutamyltranspeptidase / glutathione hydrolase
VSAVRLANRCGEIVGAADLMHARFLEMMRRIAAWACAAALASIVVNSPAAAQRGAREGQPIIASSARILPVIARNGMVVSQEARATRIGVEILRQGGNAIDAAVATGFALAVTLPRAGNLGGGGFMLVHLAKEGRTIAIDYRETAPADTPRDVFLDAQGNFVPQKSQSSGLAVGVPGTVAGLAHAHGRYGSGKFTLAQLIAPAIRLAYEGFDVDDDLADSLPFVQNRLARYPSSRAIFLKSDGAPLHQGDRLVQRDLATSLEAIARSGPDAFYKGWIAEKIVAAVRAESGRMTREDLARYAVVEREPVRGLYRGREILSMPPPSSGGVHLVQILNILEGWPMSQLGHNSAAALHRMSEAMKRAYADRAEFMGDPDYVSMPLVRLLSKPYADQQRAAISLERATPADQIGKRLPAASESDQTTHFSVADVQGNAVANTYTLNFSYGLGMVAAGTGILLNNELDDFAAKPGAPNAYGLIGGEANAPGPNKRPLSSMSPAMVFRDGKLEIVTGSPGGSRIITIVLQVVANIIDFGMNAAEAGLAPRVHHQWRPDALYVEQGISADTIAILQRMGHRIRQQRAAGSTQTIHRVNGVYHGAADTRQRGSLAAGY